MNILSNGMVRVFVYKDKEDPEAGGTVEERTPVDVREIIAMGNGTTTWEADAEEDEDEDE